MTVYKEIDGPEIRAHLGKMYKGFNHPEIRGGYRNQYIGFTVHEKMTGNAEEQPMYKEIDEGKISPRLGKCT